MVCCQELRLPPKWQNESDIAALQLRAKPYIVGTRTERERGREGAMGAGVLCCVVWFVGRQDNEDLVPICYRGMDSNPLVRTNLDSCVHCGHPFVRDFLSFETLPLVCHPPTHTTHIYPQGIPPPISLCVCCVVCVTVRWSLCPTVWMTTAPYRPSTRSRLTSSDTSRKTPPTGNDCNVIRAAHPPHTHTPHPLCVCVSGGGRAEPPVVVVVRTP